MRRLSPSIYLNLNQLSGCFYTLGLNRKDTNSWIFLGAIDTWTLRFDRILGRSNGIIAFSSQLFLVREKCNGGENDDVDPCYYSCSSITMGDERLMLLLEPY